MSLHVDPDWWKTLFDEVYLVTDARSVCDSDITRREVDLICSLLSMKNDHRILDLCGGHGRHSLELSGRGFTACTLLDYSSCLLENAMAEARSAHLPIHCVRADARRTGLGGGHYHHVLVMGNSLGYISDKDADKEILMEAKRLLCRGGTILVDITNGKQVKERMAATSWHEIPPDCIVCRNRELEGQRLKAREVVISKKNGLIRDRTYAIRLYSPESIKALLKKVGFQHVEVVTDFSPHAEQGDYGFMNCRMVATGQKQ